MTFLDYDSDVMRDEMMEVACRKQAGQCDVQPAEVSCSAPPGSVANLCECTCCTCCWLQGATGTRWRLAYRLYYGGLCRVPLYHLKASAHLMYTGTRT